MTNIEKTGIEYTITLSSGTYNYIIENNLLFEIKEAIYSINSIDTVINYNCNLIVNCKDVDINPSDILAKVCKVIGHHTLSQAV